MHNLFPVTSVDPREYGVFWTHLKKKISSIINMYEYFMLYYFITEINHVNQSINVVSSRSSSCLLYLVEYATM